MNAKIYTGNVQPNPKEYKVWVNDEGVIKTYNGETWVEQSGSSDTGGNEGGNTGGGEAASSVEYLDISGLSSDVYEPAVSLAFIAKKESYIAPPMIVTSFGDETSKISAIGIDLNLKWSIEGTETTSREYMEMIGLIEIINTIPRITKEEFYTI